MLEIINTLKTIYQLLPHPEGGFYAETYKSSLSISTLSNSLQNETRQAITSIYYLLTSEKGGFSAWHRLKSDEIWYFHEGGSLYIYIIDQKGQLHTHLLGNPWHDKKAVYQISIPANCWFAAELKEKESFSFVSCAVAPGFEFSDFELGNRKLLSSQYPEHKAIIYRLTRSPDKSLCEI